MDIQRVILKCPWKHKETRRTKAVLKDNHKGTEPSVPRLSFSYCVKRMNDTSKVMDAKAPEVLPPR